MDVLITFVPLILNALIVIAIIYFIWRVFTRRSNDRDQMLQILQQIMAKNKELEAKVDQLIERINAELVKK